MTRFIKCPTLNLAQVRISRLGDGAPPQAPHWMGSLLKTVSPSPSAALATPPHPKSHQKESYDERLCTNSHLNLCMADNWSSFNSQDKLCDEVTSNISEVQGKKLKGLIYSANRHLLNPYHTAKPEGPKTQTWSRLPEA